MRIYLLFPLAFVSGIYGFFFFAPYLLTIVAMGHFIRIRREAARQAGLAPVAIVIDQSFEMTSLIGAV